MRIGTPAISEKSRAGRSMQAAWLLRRRVVLAIAGQELRDALFGWAVYATAAISLLLSTLFVYNALNFVGGSGLLILGRPFFIPLLLTSSFALLYMASWATLAIARPRDQGSLRVLFFAPVDGVGLISGHVLAGLAIYALIVLIATPLLWVLSLITNLPFPPQMLIGLLVSPVFGALATAIGLFISSVATSSRSAIFFFGAALLVVLAIPAGYSAMLSIPPVSRYYDALLFLRELLRVLRDLLNWISPFALCSTALDAALRGNWLELLQRVLVGAAGCVAWAWLAVWGLQRRGVLP